MKTLTYGCGVALLMCAFGVQAQEHTQGQLEISNAAKLRANAASDVAGSEAKPVLTPIDINSSTNQTIENLTSETAEDLSFDDGLNPAVKQLPQLVERIQVEHAVAQNPYVLLPHKPNYLLPIAWQSSPGNEEFDKVYQHIVGDPTATRDHGFNELELVFQISLKAVLAEGFWGRYSKAEVAYTNRSFWQAYNERISRPFRETNHEPEIIFSWQLEYDWIDYVALSFNHQSNGQTSTLSRSWNRIIVDGATVFPVGVLKARVWWRIPESSSGDALNPAGDDNPDIEHYMGPGELQFIYVHGRHNLSIMARNNFDFHSNKGAIELGWSFPLNKRFKGYVQYFNGYGESLIDYNYAQQRIGIGIKLSDWL